MTVTAFTMIFGNPDHFHLRKSSWFMAGINFLIGIAMIINPDMMTHNPGARVYFAHLLEWISPQSWRNIFLFIGSIRLIALVINGRVPLIWWTPHIRAVTTFISFAIWVQFDLSLVLSGITSTDTVLYGGTAFIELYNIRIASTEAWGSGRGKIGQPS